LSLWKLKAEAQKAARKAYNNYIHDIISPDQTGNPKIFWSFIKTKKQEKILVLLLWGEMMASCFVNFQVL
jgi:hypothetical protein